MGSLGGKMKVTEGAGILTVNSLSPAGPAALAGLLSGDIITGVEGLAFTQTSLNSNDGYQGALNDLTRGMEFASSHDGLLDLSLIRPGVGSLALTADIGMTPLGPAWPGTSAKGSAIFDKSCQSIHELVQASGSDNFGSNSGWMGLILLSHPNWAETRGPLDFRNSIEELRVRCEAYLNGRILEPLEPYFFDGSDVLPDPNHVSSGLENWDVCSSAILLALHRQKTGDSTLDAVLQRAAEMIGHRIQSWDQYDDPGLPHVLGGGLGRMGHGGVQGDYSHYDGIGALNIINAQALCALGLLRQAGVDMNVNLGRSPNSKAYDTLQLSPTIEDKFRYCWDYVKQATNTNGGDDDGNVGYVTPQSGWDSAGRTPGSLAGWYLYGLAPNADDSDKLSRQAAYTARRWYRQQHSHAYTQGGVVLSQLAMPFLADREERYFQENTRLFATLTQEPDSSISYLPGRQNNGGDGYLGKTLVGYINAAIPRAIASGNLPGFPARDGDRFHPVLTSHLHSWPEMGFRLVKVEGLSQSFAIEIMAEDGSQIPSSDYNAVWSQTGGSGAHLAASGGSLDITFPSNGDYEFQLEVTHDGITQREVYAVQVRDPAPAPLAPFFITEPASISIPQGEAFTLSVDAQGTGPLLYQWFLGPAALGAASPERNLVITSASAGSAGDYTCQVTNAGGTATSSVATVTVEGVGNFVYGGLWRDVFYGIPGSNVSDLTSSPSFPSQPDSSGPISGGEAPAQAGGDYGQRWSGWITAPETGDYRFYVAADDTAELWLSDDSSRANRSLIAAVPFWTNERQWNRFSSQRSSQIALIAGQPYYLEVLQKEGGGGDHLAITWDWESPGVWSTPADGSAPLPGAVLEYQVGGTMSDTATPPGNYPPSAVEASYLVYGGGETAVPLSGNDPEGSALSYTLTTLPTKGSLTGTAPNLTYIPFPNQSGSDLFKFTVNDGTSNSEEATVLISLIPESTTDLLVWDGSDSADWETAANWVANRTPAVTDVILFDDRSLNNLATSLPLDRTVSRVVIENPGGEVSINNQTLTIVNGIEMGPATNNLLLESNIALDASQQWNIGAARTLTLNGDLQGANQLTLQKTGTGTLTLDSPSSYNGGIEILEGHLNLQGGGWYAGSVGGSGPLTVREGASAENINAHAFGSSNNSSRDLILDRGSFLVAAETYLDDLTMTAGEVANSSGSPSEIRTRSGSGSVITINPADDPAIISCGLNLIGDVVIEVAVGLAAPEFKLSGELSSGGKLLKTGPGTMELSSFSSHSGDFDLSEGTLLLIGSLSADSDLTIDAGAVLSGTGTAAGLISQDGMISPGVNGTAILTLGACTQSSTAITEVQIGGVNVGSGYDQLAVVGNATLGGTLNVTLTDGFLPEPGNQFLILTAQNRTNQFSQINLPPLPADREWTTTYDAFGTPSLTLGVEAVAPFLAWQQESFGIDASSPAIAGPTADPDQDGVSNLMEYALGLSPLAPWQAEGEQPFPSLSNTSAGTEFRYRKNPTATDLTYTILESDDLGLSDAWAPATLDGDTLQEMDGAIEVRAATLPEPLAPQRFYRLRVELGLP